MKTQHKPLDFGALNFFFQQQQFNPLFFVYQSIGNLVNSELAIALTKQTN